MAVMISRRHEPLGGERGVAHHGGGGTVRDQYNFHLTVPMRITALARL